MNNGDSKNHTHKHTIYLVRHGESAANVSQINLPPEEDILTENGRSQADLLGKHMKDIVFTKAYASNYARANDTANFVLTNSNMQKKPELKTDNRIREREMGDYIGKPASVPFRSLIAAASKGTPLHKFEIPGGETCAEFDDRIDSFLDDLFKDLQNSTQPETVLIASHGLTIIRLMTKFKENGHFYSTQSWTPTNACRPMKNTSYHIFNVQVPAPDRPDKDEKIHLEFLHYHQRPHLEHLEEPTDPTKPQPADPVTLAMQKLAEHGLDPTQTKQCVIQ